MLASWFIVPVDETGAVAFSLIEFERGVPWLMLTSLLIVPLDESGAVITCSVENEIGIPWLMLASLLIVPLDESGAVVTFSVRGIWNPLEEEEEGKEKEGFNGVDPPRKDPPNRNPIYQDLRHMTIRRLVAVPN